jgi:hypothetical protein
VFAPGGGVCSGAGAFVAHAVKRIVNSAINNAP